MICLRCKSAPASVPFGPLATHCIPCALLLNEDERVISLAPSEPDGCVVPGCGEPGTVRDPDTRDLYCSVDAATILSTFVATRRVERALAPYLHAPLPAYEAYQGAVDGEMVFCTCGNTYERGGACNAREPRDPAQHGEYADAEAV